MFERIKALIIEQLSVLDPDDIKMDTSFDSMDVDSIDAVEIIMAIEDEFEVEIPDEVAQDFNCIGDIVHYLNQVGLEE